MFTFGSEIGFYPTSSAGAVSRLWSVPDGGVDCGPPPDTPLRSLGISVGDPSRENRRHIGFLF